MGNFCISPESLHSDSELLAKESEDSGSRLILRGVDDDDGNDDGDGDGDDDDDDDDDEDDEDDVDDDDDDGEEEEERKMMMLMLMWRRRRKMRLIRRMLRRKTDPKTGKHTVCEPAQATCAIYREIDRGHLRGHSRNAHGHFTRAILCGNLAPDTTSIEHRALSVTVRTPQCGQKTRLCLRPP